MRGSGIPLFFNRPPRAIAGPLPEASGGYLRTCPVPECPQECLRSPTVCSFSLSSLHYHSKSFSMAMCKLTFVVLAVMVLCAQGIPRFHNIQKRENSVRLCGNMLVEMLALVCNSIYYDPSRATREQQKKSNFYPENWDDSNNLKDPLEFRPHRNAGGIADECCKKPCSIRTLMSYCGTSNVQLQV